MNGTEDVYPAAIAVSDPQKYDKLNVSFISKCPYCGEPVHMEPYWSINTCGLKEDEKLKFYQILEEYLGIPVFDYDKFRDDYYDKIHYTEEHQKNIIPYKNKFKIRTYPILSFTNGVFLTNRDNQYSLTGTLSHLLEKGFYISEHKITVMPKEIKEIELYDENYIKIKINIYNKSFFKKDCKQCEIVGCILSAEANETHSPYGINGIKIGDSFSEALIATDTKLLDPYQANLIYREMNKEITFYPPDNKNHISHYMISKITFHLFPS